MNDRPPTPETTTRADAWWDLAFALFVLSMGIGLMFTDAKALGGLIVGSWVGRYM